MSKRFGLRRYAGLTVIVAAAALIFAGIAVGVSGAINTTDDPGFAGAGVLGAPAACLNGVPDHTTPAVNCNIYTDKTDVFLSGSPVSAALGDGTYFFDVLVPGGQPTPNDAAIVPDTSQATSKNLSDDFDAWTNREFTVTGDTIVMLNGSSHAYDSATNEVQVAPFANTLNPGGVYILAVCKVPTVQSGTPGVEPRDCKYDAFKVKQAVTCDPANDLNCPTPPAADLTVLKDVTPSFTREFNWSITKGVDACQVTLLNPNGCSVTGSSKTLNYTVTVTKDGGADSGWQASGDITIFNPNDNAATSVVVTDAIASGPSCDVDSGNTVSTGGDVGTLASGASLTLPYVCDFSVQPAYNTDYTNTATVSWDNTSVGTTNSSTTFSLAFQFTDPTTVIHNSVNVSDLLTSTNPTLPSTGFAVGDPVATNNSDPVGGTLTSGKTFTYSRTLTVPHNCLTVNNTASFSATDPEDTGTDTDDSGSSSVSAKVCRTPATTGALTMGFWQNKNGQGIITGQAKTGVCPSATWLRQFAPFQNLSATATCAAVGTYDLNVFKAATCSGPSTAPCNAMLKAQMLATAFDVYFSDPSLGGNKINAPHPIGGVTIDLTNICKMIDGTGGTASCGGTYEDTSSAFDDNASLSVFQMLVHAAAHSDLGGTTWYGNIKATQVLAKDAFDAVNNQVAFSV
jgi:hypothetical protein